MTPRAAQETAPSGLTGTSGRYNRPLCPVIAPHGRRCWASTSGVPSPASPLSNHLRLPAAARRGRAGRARARADHLLVPQARRRPGCIRAEHRGGRAAAVHDRRRARRAAVPGRLRAGSTRCSTARSDAKKLREENEALRQQAIQNQFAANENDKLKACSRSATGRASRATTRASPPR